jgi:hypothetical protein
MTVRLFLNTAYHPRSPTERQKTLAGQWMSVCDYLAKIMNPLVANVTASGRQEVYTRVHNLFI